VIVVSEETGIVSVAHRGRLKRGISTAELSRILAAGELPEGQQEGVRIAPA
jgi:hypothetical protein